MPRRNPKSATAEPIPWWLSVFTLSVVLLLAAAVVSSERVAPALAGIGLAGLMLVRLYAMTPRWPLRPARQGFVIRRSQGDLDRSSL